MKAIIPKKTEQQQKISAALKRVWKRRKDMKNAREIKISFCVSGHVSQTIRLLNSCELTPEEIVKGLNEGTIATTVYEGGKVDMVADGKNIGEIIDLDNNLEYTDYDLERPLV
jgi:hypothetical protein